MIDITSKAKIYSQEDLINVVKFILDKKIDSIESFNSEAFTMGANLPKFINNGEKGFIFIPSERFITETEIINAINREL